MSAVMSSSQKPMVMVSMILLQRKTTQLSPFFVSSYEKDQNHLVTGDSIHLRYPGEHRLTLEDVASVYEVSQRSPSIFQRPGILKIRFVNEFILDVQILLPLFLAHVAFTPCEN